MWLPSWHCYLQLWGLGDGSLGCQRGGEAAAFPWEAQLAGWELGTLGTCWSVAAEEDYCHLEREKKGLLHNDRGWERAKSFGIFSVSLQSGAMCSQ